MIFSAIGVGGGEVVDGIGINIIEGVAEFVVVAVVGREPVGVEVE